MRTKVNFAIRDLIESHGADKASLVIRDLVEEKKVDLNSLSIKGIWEACQKAEGQSTNVQEAIVSYSFPKITGELVNAKVIDGYEGIQLIGDQLVTTIPARHRVETFAGFTAVDSPDEVGETEEYSQTSLTEKYVQITSKKYGEMIYISEEMIYFDQTGQIINRASEIGRLAAQWRERLILRAIQDLDTTAYYPSGTATAVYSAANDNLISTNPFGESGMEGLKIRMQRQKSDALGHADDNFVFINPADLKVLVPADLEVEAMQLANSVLVPESAENAVNVFKGMFTTLSSPYISVQSATTWYAGDFKRDAVWAEIWPLQTIAMRPGSSVEFTRDIKSAMKTRFFGGAGFLDTKHVYKCTA